MLVSLALGVQYVCGACKARARFQSAEAYRMGSMECERHPAMSRHAAVLARCPPASCRPSARKPPTLISSLPARCLSPFCAHAQGTAETGGDARGNLDKARSLGSAMLVITALPWALCALFFSGLHWTYPKDKRRAEEEVLQTHPAVIELAEEGPAAVGGVGHSYESVLLPARLQKGEYTAAGGTLEDGEPGDDKEHLLARREDSALEAGDAAGVALGAQRGREAGVLD